MGLVLVIEGLVYCGFPGLAKRLATEVLSTPENALADRRSGGDCHRRGCRLAGARVTEVLSSAIVKAANTPYFLTTRHMRADLRRRMRPILSTNAGRHYCMKPTSNPARGAQGFACLDDGLLRRLVRWPFAHSDRISCASAQAPAQDAPRRGCSGHSRCAGARRRPRAMHGPASVADLAEGLLDIGRQHIHVADREGHGRSGRRANAATARRLAVPGFLRRFLQGPRWRRPWRIAEGAVARLRLRGGCRAGHRRDQQPRDRRRRRDRGQLSPTARN